MERIGWVGCGLMGRGMAMNLLKAGHAVTVIAHRRREGVEALLAAGAREADSLEALAHDSDAVGLCVTDAPAVEATVAGLAPGLAEGALVLDATTSQPETSRRMAERLAERGVRFADVPVTGGPPQAEAGALATLAGCAEADWPRVEALCGRYSKVARRFGEVGAGNAAKLINNFVTQSTQAVLSEAFERAREVGLDRRALYDVMMTGGARSAILERTMPKALDGEFDGSRFALRNALKDVRYYCAFAEGAGGLSPTAEATRGVLEAAAEGGHGDRFVSALFDREVAALFRRLWRAGGG